LDTSKILPLLSEVKVNRFFYKACGYIDKELDKPLIAVISSYTDTSPGHLYLDKIAEAAKKGVYMAGGATIEAYVIGPCAAYSRNYRYDLPTRDVIAQSIEIQLQQSTVDGIIFIGTCDKILPGMLMAAARLNLPAIFLTGGPAEPGHFMGEETVFPLDTLVPLIKKYIEGELGYESLKNKILKAEEKWINTCGACPELTTANTMQILIESMGLTIPYSSTTPPHHSSKLRYAKVAGTKIVELIQKGLSFKKLVKEENLLNSLRVLNAIGGSTNAVIHILALSNELGLIDRVNLDTVEEVSSDTPFISPLRPNGPYTILDLHRAGGVPALLKELKPILTDTETVIGKTLFEIADEAPEPDGDVIRSLEKPVQRRGALKVLKGNIAPGGALARYTAVKKEHLRFTGPAKICDSLEDAVIKIIAGEIENGDVLVVRYEGPRGAPGMTEIVIVIFLLRMLGLTDVAVVTDGRYSGTAEEVLYIGYVVPEAYIGGPLAALRDGDMVTIDIEEGKLEAEVSLEELDKRMENWRPVKPKITMGALVAWAYLAEQADKGAIIKNKL
jgi:dihydroxy-acid dehydratase